MGEGINSSVVIAQRGDQKFFYVSGKSEASSVLLDMRLQRMMGHLPALITFRRRVRCWWSGSARESLPDLSFPTPRSHSIVICELEPLIPPASDEFFGKENNHVLRDPRTRVVYDDARHYILITPDKFDVITTDPIHPWVKGTSTLYSKEYYELVKSHLNPGGVAAQWLPIYESDEDTVKTELATFFSVFPNATVWSNYLNGDGYDLVLLGSADASPINVNAVAAAPGPARLRRRVRVAGRSRVPFRRGFAGDLRGQSLRPGADVGQRSDQRRSEYALAVHGGAGAELADGSPGLSRDPVVSQISRRPAGGQRRWRECACMNRLGGRTARSDAMYRLSLVCCALSC